jgi:hypothetical protein
MTTGQAWARRAALLTAALVLLTLDAIALGAIALLLCESVGAASQGIAVRKRS